MNPLKITIAPDESACPPWHRSFDFEGTEQALRSEIERDAAEIGVRYHYTACESEPGLWHVWRIL